MTNPADLLYRATERPPAEGIVSRAPSSGNGLLLVQVPSFDAEDESQGTKMRWPGPRGEDLPIAGDHCLVVYTQDGTPWVAAWWPSGYETSTPPPTGNTDDGDDGPTATGTAWMPDVRVLRRSSAGSWALDCDPKGILHTTEGSGDATETLDTNGDHPHFQVERSGRITQYIAVSEAAKALKHTGVETNRAHALQIEVCGFAAHPGDWPAVQKAAVRKVMRFIEANAGVERASHVPFVADSSQRLSDSAWIAAKGWLGHQHVPDNDHWDPGAIDIDALL